MIAMVARRRSLALALALLAPVAAIGFAGLAPTGEAQQAPRGDDWQLEPRSSPGDGFRLTTVGTVDGQPATVERQLSLDEGELSITYTLGDEDDPDRQVQAHLRPAGVYVFEDDGDGRLQLDDRVVDHQRVDEEADAYLTPVRVTQPLFSSRGVFPLEDGGRVVVTATATSDVAMMRGSQLTPTETRLNVTAAGLSLEDDHHVALAFEAGADSLAEDTGSLVRLEGTGAGVSLDRLGAIDARGDPGSATVLADKTTDPATALVLLSGPQQPTNAHEAEANVVHTSTGLEDVAETVRGEAGPYLLGLVAASALVGTAAWRKLN